MASFQLTVPDNAVPLIRRVFGGTTNTETLANVRTFLLAELRVKVLEGCVSQRRNVDMETIATGEADERSDFATEWPE